MSGAIAGYTEQQVDEMVAEAGGTNRWLREDRLFAGSLAQAVSAFGGELVGEEGGGAWIILKDTDGQLMGRKLAEFRGTTGQQIWFAADALRSSVSCGE